MSEAWQTELERDRKARSILVVAAVVGIVASASLGIGFALGAFEATGASGPRNPAALIFFVGPFVACMVVGTVIGWFVRRLRR